MFLVNNHFRFDLFKIMDNICIDYMTLKEKWWGIQIHYVMESLFK